jgi:hypothetical protein
MNTTAEIPWVPLASSLVAGLVAYVVATRAVPALVRATLRELDYRANDLDTLVKWRR